jgi:hypothetical protein
MQETPSSEDEELDCVKEASTKLLRAKSESQKEARLMREASLNSSHASAKSPLGTTSFRSSGSDFCLEVEVEVYPAYSSGCESSSEATPTCPTLGYVSAIQPVKVAAAVVVPTAVDVYEGSDDTDFRVTTGRSSDSDGDPLGYLGTDYSTADAEESSEKPPEEIFVSIVQKPDRLKGRYFQVPRV